MTAMPYTREKPSPYYPPRARWYSPVLNAFDSVRRRLALDRLNPSLAANVNLLELVASFLVPALGFYFRLPRLLGLALIAWALVLVLAFFVFLGQWEDNFIFSMLLSLHVSGFIFYCTPLLGPSVWQRLGFTLGMVLAIYLLIYLPAQSLLQAYAVTPLQVRERIVVVAHIYSTPTIRAGDKIAYTTEGNGAGGIYVERGTDVAQVVAVPGDVITFNAGTYRVNGVAHPRLPFMPQSGKCVVPQKEWFIWPNFVTPERQLDDDRMAAASAALMRIALVTEDQFVGRPLQRWFWWKQQ